MADKPLLINYNQLNSLWLRWLSEPEHTVLDRWLKREAADWRRRFKETMPLELGLAMQHAVRFQQLACALEKIQGSGVEQDWEAWAADWRPGDADELGRNNFWFWIQGRSRSQWYIPKDWQAGSRRQTVADTEAWVKAHPDSALALLWHGLSPELLPLMRERAEASGWSDQQLQRFIALQSTRPPLWLRPRNDQKAESLLAELQSEGVDASRNSHGLCATGGFGLTQTSAYKEGRIEIQDYASQQIVAAVDARPGEKIWDACAGAGGKSLTIADSMKGKGAVVATDLHQYKLDELKKRARRGGQLNIRTFTWEGNEPLRLPQEVARQQGFDKVLVDAPCSATGTWRRNPDARLRSDAMQPTELASLQQQLLSNASAAVRPAGKLIYATCSWLTEENEQAVATFLAAHPQFSLVSQTICGAPDVDADTMFVAVMEKQA